MTRRILCLAAVLCLPLTATAQSAKELTEMDPETRRQYLQSMSDEERAAMREKWRAEIDAMPAEDKRALREQRRARVDERRSKRRDKMADLSDEERAARKAERQTRLEERRARWEAMSEEERAAARDKRLDKKGKRRHRHREGKPEAEESAN